MKFKSIHFILNPAAGSKEPILSHINKVFGESGIKWDISLTKKGGDATKITKSLKGKTDLIAVYGGDGSLTEVAAALYGSDMPMGIVPGGTANVMAKELGIPLDTLEALELLKSGRKKIVKMDMGLLNDHPFMLRVNLGIMAEMIIDADRKLKDSLGQIAYGITAIQSLVKAEPINYHLLIDGKKVNEKGVALTVTNSGSLGIKGFDLLPGISVTDGFLDVILLTDSDIMSVLKVAGSTLLQNDSEVLKHWKCKEVVIRLEKAEPYICDDWESKAKKLHIKIVPGTLNVVVPSA
ncbi:MAG: YegS/Rv2252/BmrU family lipid kinase [Mucilaginibacter sp.]|nr:YegS/Rv2252/BmrU family lipid kinase [Mucilaginibacter sp.]